MCKKSIKFTQRIRMRKLFMFVVACAMGVAFLGCGTPPVYNVNNNAIAVPADKKASMSEVEKAIIRAGGGLGWIVKKEKEGLLKATLVLRTHTAVVAITYNTQEYSINYVSSINLDYNAEANTIHSNYNGWIQNLNKAIQVQLSLL